jgi:hypothetical protein
MNEFTQEFDSPRQEYPLAGEYQGEAPLQEILQQEAPLHEAA